MKISQKKYRYVLIVPILFIIFIIAFFTTRFLLINNECNDCIKKAEQRFGRDFSFDILVDGEYYDDFPGNFKTISFNNSMSFLVHINNDKNDNTSFMKDVIQIRNFFSDYLNSSNIASYFDESKIGMEIILNQDNRIALYNSGDNSTQVFDSVHWSTDNLTNSDVNLLSEYRYVNIISLNCAEVELDFSSFSKIERLEISGSGFLIDNLSPNDILIESIKKQLPDSCEFYAYDNLVMPDRGKDVLWSGLPDEFEGTKTVHYIYDSTGNVMAAVYKPSANEADEIDRYVKKLKNGVIDPDISDHFFWDELTPEQIADKAFAYKAICL